METIRIPKRYKNQISRLKKEDRLLILDTLFSLADGQNIDKPDEMVGDIIELIWRDALQMEKKGRNEGVDKLGKYVPTMSHLEEKGSEVKRTEQKTVCASKIPVVSPTTKECFIWVVENTPSLVEMKDPITEGMAVWFNDNYPEDIWKDVFEAMDNYPNIKTKYKSAKSTANAWLKRRGWLSYERMRTATYFEAKEVLNERAMGIYKNKNPQGYAGGQQN